MTVHLEMIVELAHRTQKYLVRVFSSIVYPLIGDVWRQREILFTWSR